MKKAALFFVICLGFSFTALSQSQGYCDCESLFDSCRINCPAGTTPDCGTSWYGGCNCECKERMIDPGPVDPPGGGTQAFNMQNIKLLKDFLKDEAKIKVWEQLVSEMENCLGKNNLVLVNNEEYQNYSHVLRKLFLSLSHEDQYRLYSRTI